jgi:alpha-L-fucosidase
MFIHFNVATYNEREWANGHEDPSSFAPDKLDCGQWADAAESAGMDYAVLTVKHTGGWCLWDSKHTESHDATAFKNYKNGKSDIVREFVDAFRARGLRIGLYYCAPGDYTGKHGNVLLEGEENLYGMPPEAKEEPIEFMKKQLTELLKNYGPIDLLWIDQYRKMGDAWPGVMQHVKSLQPNCLIIANNSHDPAETDIFSYEYPWMMERNPELALPPEDNRHPGEVCDIFSKSWFWNTDEEASHLKSAEKVADMINLCNSRRANYLLNVAPDKTGRLPEYTIKRLREVGDLLDRE